MGITPFQNCNKQLDFFCQLLNLINRVTELNDLHLPSRLELSSKSNITAKTNLPLKPLHSSIQYLMFQHKTEAPLLTALYWKLQVFHGNTVFHRTIHEILFICHDIKK